MARSKTSWKSKSLWPDIKDAISAAQNIVVFDLETTGLSPQNDRIIEIAAVKYKIDPAYEMTEIGVYHQYINPERALSDTIVDLTGITDAMLADKPTEAECIDDIQKFFDGCVVAGYNITNFDNKFMNELYGRFGRFFTPAGCVDAIKMARNRLERGTDVEDFKLKTVGNFFGIDFTAHSAIEDTRTTGKLVQIFLREYYTEETEPDTSVTEGTIRPNIRTISYWPGFKGFARIYVNMDIGSVYYDIRSSVWGGKDIEPATLDMAWIEQEVFRITGSKSEQEFSSFKGNINVA